MHEIHGFRIVILPGLEGLIFVGLEIVEGVAGFVYYLDVLEDGHGVVIADDA